MAALVGAGCASDDDAGGDSFEGGELGAVTIAPGEPIEIGSIQVQSGDDANLGVDQDRAIAIAIEDRGGELLDHPIRLHAEDGECSAEGGTNAAQRIVSEPQIVGVIGTSCSGEAVPASPIVTGAGMPLISGSNTAPALTSDLEGTEGEDHHHGYLRVAHNDIHQGAAAAEYAYNELGARTVATIHDGDPYTEGLTSAFGRSFEDLGGEVVLPTAVDKDDTDMRAVLTEVAAADPDVVFFPIFQPAIHYLADQMREFPELSDPDMMMSADASLNDNFIALEQANNIYFSGPATPTGSAYEEFVDKYEADNGEQPIAAFHAHAYDSVNMLFAAIEEVAQVEDDGTIHIDRAELLDALYDTSGFEGLTGTLTCDEFGDCADPAINIVHNTEETESASQVLANVLHRYEPEEDGAEQD